MDVVLKGNRLMKDSSRRYIEEIVVRYPALEVCFEAIVRGTEIIIECYRNGGKLLLCGNGGSAADCEHIVGELMKGFCLSRKLSAEKAARIRNVLLEDADDLISHLQEALPAISLISHTSLSTAFSNDLSADYCFAQQVYGYGRPGDVLIAISTSGNSKNVIFASQIAKSIGMKVLALTGQNGGKLKAWSDVLINVPSNITHHIQEYHLPIYHTICMAVENDFFGTQGE